LSELVRLVRPGVRQWSASTTAKTRRFGVRLWLDESLINAIKHGNQHDGGKNVSIELQVSTDQGTILIRDEGTRTVALLFRRMSAPVM
jgi:anti-sigma regulatory factor (Ser/Thr protein kinase)